MNARLYAIVGGIAVVLLAVALTASAQAGEPASVTTAKGPLKESLRFPSEQLLRKRLVAGAMNNLGVVAERKNETSILVRANCEVARERVRLYAAGTADDCPLMLAASLTVLNNGREFLTLWALNLSRETGLVLLEGTTSTGRHLRAVYDLHPAYKDTELVFGFVDSVDRVGPQEFLRLGGKQSRKVGDEVHIDVPAGKLPIPDMHPLVAAIVDTRGHTSNFVEVVSVKGGRSMSPAPERITGYDQLSEGKRVVMVGTTADLKGTAALNYQPADGRVFPVFFPPGSELPDTFWGATVEVTGTLKRGQPSVIPPGPRRVDGQSRVPSNFSGVTPGDWYFTDFSWKIVIKQITNSIGMKLTRVPSGEFMMGSKESAEAEAAFFNKTYGENSLQADWFKDEHPQHRVRITKPFYLGTYHVTRGQFRQFVKDAGYKTDAEKGKNPGAWGWDPDKKEFGFNEKYSWRHAGFEQTDEHPVVNVSWNNAVAFCKWLSKKEGKTYRLPTEAEWEYACRAGTTTRYSSGDDPETLAKAGNVADAAAKAKFPDWKWTIKANDGYVFTAPVGKFKPNAFGLYDMHGNAWQWCADSYGAEYYAKSPVDDPTGPASGSDRVLRGGSWDFGPDFTRSAVRNWYDPDDGLNVTGFRVARTQ